MAKELIRLSDCTMSFDGEVVLDGINQEKGYNSKKEHTDFPSSSGK